MNVITGNHIERRTFLKGMGSTVALPFLDAMIPAATAAARTPLHRLQRLGYVFMPMGCDQSRWTPRSERTLDKLSPILDSLAPVKDKLSVFTNMELRPAYPGSHATSNSSFLSAAKAKVTESTDYYLGTTADQVAAKHAGPTYVRSLALSFANGMGTTTLSRNAMGADIPATADYQAVFNRLFPPADKATTFPIRSP